MLEQQSEVCKPYVVETPRYKSLHFARNEIQSRMLKRDPDKLVVDYTRTMMGFLMFHSQPERIAMLGLGGGSLAKYCYRELPGAQIDVVEINPHVIALRDTFQVPPDDARFRIHQDDGARFIARSTRQFDVLLVDAYTLNGLPRRLASQEFFDSCRAALTNNGVMVLNLFCRNSESLMDRIHQSFDGEAFSLLECDETNRIVFACSGDAFRQRRSPLRELPAHLGRDAWWLLKPSLLRVALAVRTQLGGHVPSPRPPSSKGRPF